MPESRRPGGSSPSVPSAAPPPAAGPTPVTAEPPVERRGGRNLRWIFYLSLLLLLSGSLAHALFGYSHFDLAGHAWGTDDAYISFRYARNLVHGDGLVYNAGERVEGYSNLLYVLLIAPLLLSGADAYLCSVVLNLALISAAFVLFCWHAEASLARRQGAVASSFAAGAAALLFALCPPLWMWVGSGMETPLVILLTIALWVFVRRVVGGGGRRDVWLLAGVTALTVLARADGFVPAAIALSYLGLRRRWPALIRCGSVGGIVLGLHVLWRFTYYGYLMPNTYYLKVSGPLLQRFSAAANLLLDIAAWRGLLPYAVLLLFVTGSALRLALRRGSRITEALRFETYFAILWLGYFFFVGGDVFVDRFIVILVPLGIFVLLEDVASAAPARAFTFLVLLVAGAQWSVFRTDLRFEYTASKYDRWVTLGTFLRERYAGRTLAIDASGKVPFYSGLRTIDMLGLTDAHIAHLTTDYFRSGHNKFDLEYVLSRRPDLIGTFIRMNGALDWGLTPEVYRPAGYRLRYLVNGNKHSRGEDVIDLTGMEGRTVMRLVSEGNNYALLEKVPS